MGALRKAFDSVLYAIAIATAVYMSAFVFGITHQFSLLFSPAGFVVFYFLIFSLVGK